jgi:hypothetical protein
VRFTAGKDLRGESLGDLVGNARFEGKLGEKVLRGRFAIPGNNARFGEISLKLKEEPAP